MPWLSLRRTEDQATEAAGVRGSLIPLFELNGVLASVQEPKLRIISAVVLIVVCTFFVESGGGKAFSAAVVWLMTTSSSFSRIFFQAP